MYDHKIQLQRGQEVQIDLEGFWSGIGVKVRYEKDRIVIDYNADAAGDVNPRRYRRALILLGPKKETAEERTPGALEYKSWFGSEKGA